MDFIARTGDIIVLDEDVHYKVLHRLKMEGRGYLIVRKIKMSVESILQLDEQSEEIVQEVIDENNDYYFSFVTDEDVVSKIRKALEIYENK